MNEYNNKNILIIIDYKGKRYKKYFKLNDNKELIKVYILITDTTNKCTSNYHFICNVKNNTVSIPSTSIIPKESSYIYLTFNKSKFNIPIHSIYELGKRLPTSLKLNIDFNVEL